MKYIRLKRMLEAKAREYQEVCFSEKSFIASNEKFYFQLLPLSIVTVVNGNWIKQD